MRAKLLLKRDHYVRLLKRTANTSEMLGEDLRCWQLDIEPDPAYYLHQFPGSSNQGKIPQTSKPCLTRATLENVFKALIICEMISFSPAHPSTSFLILAMPHDANPFQSPPPGIPTCSPNSVSGANKYVYPHRSNHQYSVSTTCGDILSLDSSVIELKNPRTRCAIEVARAEVVM